jgi:predicted RNase H-like HicB family nuclease
MRSFARQASNENAMRYVYVIEQAEDGSYSAFVPDLPGCTTCGVTADEVRLNIKDAVDTYIESLRDHNEPVPQSKSVADVVEAA